MANPFETGAQKNIPAVLIYARNAGQILMLHRNAPERAKVDYHAGKWNGLGGKSEFNESALETAAREFQEEAELEVEPERFKMLGVLQFPNFKPDRHEDWTVFVFDLSLDDQERSKIAKASNEGDLRWISERDLEELNLWAGDRHFISYVVGRKPFHGTIWYNGNKVERYEVNAILFDHVNSRGAALRK